jgi:hypothetical protein
MNSRLFLIPAILATTAAFGASADDAQAQAAALLSHPQTSGSSYHEPAPASSSTLVAADAQARAAALLSGVHSGHSAKTTVNASRSAVASDAHAQAAALLSGARITAKSSPVSQTSETLGQHPAVLVAQQWRTRGIDPNTFIVAHPARLELLAAPVTEETSASRASASR